MVGDDGGEQLAVDEALVVAEGAVGVLPLVAAADCGRRPVEGVEERRRGAMPEEDQDRVHPHVLERRAEPARAGAQPAAGAAREGREVGVEEGVRREERAAARARHEEKVRRRPRLLVHRQPRVAQRDAARDERRGEAEPVQHDLHGPPPQPVVREDAAEVDAEPRRRDRRHRRERALGVVHVREAPRRRRGGAAAAHLVLAATRRTVAVAVAVRAEERVRVARGAADALRQPRAHPRAEVVLPEEEPVVVADRRALGRPERAAHVARDRRPLLRRQQHRRRERGRGRGAAHRRRRGAVARRPAGHPREREEREVQQHEEQRDAPLARVRREHRRVRRAPPRRRPLRQPQLERRRDGVRPADAVEDAAPAHRGEIKAVGVAVEPAAALQQHAEEEELERAQHARLGAGDPVGATAAQILAQRHGHGRADHEQKPRHHDVGERHAVPRRVVDGRVGATYSEQVAHEAHVHSRARPLRERPWGGR